MIKILSKFYNYIQFLGWGIVLILTLLRSFQYSQTGSTDATQTIQLMQIMQTSQFVDLVFIILGVTTGSLPASFIQYGGRMITTFIYMNPQTCFCSLRNTLIPWCLAELIRFSYYENRNNSNLKFLRYNAFLLLYPFGVLGEERCVNYWINHNINDETFVLISRVYQVILVVGLAMMYRYMLVLRSKQNKNLTKTTRQSPPTSPTKKPKRE